MATPMRVGLTGGIASGKTTVAQRFADLGVPVIDADHAARQVVAVGSPGLAQVVNLFGAGVLREDGQLDRSSLRHLIFAQPAARRDLEALLHPLIRDYMEAEARDVQAPYLIMAIPLLIESAAPRQRVDRILVVDVPEALQIERLMRRDGSREVEARAIIRAQAARSVRLAAADDVIENTGSIESLRHDVEQLHAQYLQSVPPGRSGAI